MCAGSRDFVNKSACQLASKWRQGHTRCPQCLATCVNSDVLNLVVMPLKACLLPEHRYNKSPAFLRGVHTLLMCTLRIYFLICITIGTRGRLWGTMKTRTAKNVLLLCAKQDHIQEYDTLKVKNTLLNSLYCVTEQKMCSFVFHKHCAVLIFHKRVKLLPSFWITLYCSVATLRF